MSDLSCQVVVGSKGMFSSPNVGDYEMEGGNLALINTGLGSMGFHPPNLHPGAQSSLSTLLKILVTPFDRRIVSAQGAVNTLVLACQCRNPQWHTTFAEVGIATVLARTTCARPNGVDSGTAPVPQSRLGSLGGRAVNDYVRKIFDPSFATYT
eukprot:3648012-Amphidinium_carterae.1